MKSMMIAAMPAVLALPAAADAKQRSCSIQDLAGHWIFATEVGRSPLLGATLQLSAQWISMGRVT
jgi:hypothetical protein